MENEKLAQAANLEIQLDPEAGDYVGSTVNEQTASLDQFSQKFGDVLDGKIIISQNIGIWSDGDTMNLIDNSRD